MKISVGPFQLAGIGLAGVLGVLLNLVLPAARSARTTPAESTAEAAAGGTDHARHDPTSHHTGT
jgi:xanthine/uracil permease